MKILFITLSNIGDAIMTTPTLQRLHQIYPEAVIDLVCDARSQILFEYCPYRGNIYIKNKKAGKKGLFSLIKQLRRTRYDLIVDLRTDGLAYLLRAKKRLTKWGHKPYGPHAVEDLISIIDAINPDKTIPPTCVWFGQDHQDKADQLLNNVSGKKLIAVGPGANWEPKIWKADNFAKVLNGLGDQISEIIIMGGPNDQVYSEKLKNQLSRPFLDITGQTDLLTTAAVLARCQLFLGNDSGLGHLASAVDTASVSVFGPGKPERYHPWHERNIWFSGEKGDMKNIATDKVLAATSRIIGKN